MTTLCFCVQSARVQTKLLLAQEKKQVHAMTAIVLVSHSDLPVRIMLHTCVRLFSASSFFLPVDEKLPISGHEIAAYSCAFRRHVFSHQVEPAVFHKSEAFISHIHVGTGLFRCLHRGGGGPFNDILGS